jgi:hypothetical protein
MIRRNGMQRTYFTERIEEYSKKFEEAGEELERRNAGAEDSYMKNYVIYSPPNPPKISEMWSDIFMDIFNIRDGMPFAREEYKKGIVIKIGFYQSKSVNKIINRPAPDSYGAQRDYEKRLNFAFLSSEWREEWKNCKNKKEKFETFKKLFKMVKKQCTYKP